MGNCRFMAKINKTTINSNMKSMYPFKPKMTWVCGVFYNARVLHIGHVPQSCVVMPFRLNLDYLTQTSIVVQSLENIWTMSVKFCSIFIKYEFEFVGIKDLL